MFVCHCDHNLCSSFSLKGKYPVLNLLLVIVRIRISHLPHQFPINIQLVSRKNLCQANSILFFFFRKHQGHPIGTTSKRRFIFVAQVHSTVLANGNITAVVVLLLFLYFLRCQQYIRIIFPFPGKIMHRIIIRHIEDSLNGLVPPGRIFVIKAVKQKEYAHSQCKYSYYK